ncbi:MAG: hypothetical protein R3C28_21575 [Pirellulaceae bacterium]
MHAECRVVVIRMGRMHRANPGDVIHALGDMRKQRADFGPTLAVRLELPLRPLEKCVRSQAGP